MEPEPKVTIYQSAIAGGTAGAFTRAVAQPFDVIKIRFQLQLEPIKFSEGSKYASLIQALKTIHKEEGITTLWSGHVPAQFLSVSYGIVQFSAYEKLTQLCQNNDPKFYIMHKHSINFSNGAIAATLATLVSYPFDTVRTRLIAEHKSLKAYNGIVDAFSTIIRTESCKALYKGLLPTLGQIAPYAGVQFIVYKFFTESVFIKLKFFHRNVNSKLIESSLMGNLLAGSMAGFFAKTVVYPFDLIKKRLQIQGFQEYRKKFGKQIYCKGSLHCAYLTLRDEGFLALYKGYAPSMLKAVFVSALHFAVYDEMKFYLMKKL